VSLLLVTVGGLAGILARYGLGTAVPTVNLPWVTVAINVVGSFLLGALIPWGSHLSEPVRNGLAVGFCGSFTTFSTFSVEVFYDAHAGDTGFAMLYLAASVVGGILAAAVGYFTGRGLLHLTT
jgi:fluoride exporter